MELYRIARSDARLVIRIPLPAPDTTATLRNYRTGKIPGPGMPGQPQSSNCLQAAWFLERILFVCVQSVANTLSGEETMGRLVGQVDSISEIVVHLLAMKPKRSNGFQSNMQPNIEITSSALDLHCTF